MREVQRSRIRTFSLIMDSEFDELDSDHYLYEDLASIGTVKKEIERFFDQLNSNTELDLPYCLALDNKGEVEIFNLDYLTEKSNIPLCTVAIDFDELTVFFLGETAMGWRYEAVWWDFNPKPFFTFENYDQLSPEFFSHKLSAVLDQMEIFMDRYSTIPQKPPTRWERFVNFINHVSENVILTIVFLSSILAAFGGLTAGELENPFWSTTLFVFSAIFGVVLLLSLFILASQFRRIYDKWRGND